MSGSKAKERRRFLRDQQAAVLADHGRLLGEQVDAGGSLVDGAHPAADRFEERLRLWVLNRLVRRCPHLDPVNAPARSYWLVRRPDLIRCAPCLDQVLDLPAGHVPTCDHCGRDERPLTGFWVLVDTTLVLADICAACHALGGAPQ
jgi:hypothetical protein